MTKAEQDNLIQLQVGRLAALLEVIEINLPEDRLDAEVCVKCLAGLAKDLAVSVMWRMAGDDTVQMVGESTP